MAASSTIGVKVMTIVISIPVGIVTKKAVNRIWLTLRPEDPPRAAMHRDVRWSDAMGWAALSGAGIVVADLTSRRSAEAAYRALTGSDPAAQKPAKPTRGRRRLRRAQKAAIKA